ncbi:phytanoyl-CoA dioxygenase family protein [Rubellicoccus peritrichatus]|uniref:Phytanoyl-CoA dioxygenase family protein n=1 Tax=Rubellicoccus peritrichatus TaxID=3080537 RepID=A0AAQ3QUV3_9BACT|nr:phytanoyl-CoA dioxygenase family protein [Puniceicoccus sp. CR14]WOO40187.1 phytanoyl-CoA dioxygenase family protein [Puniceicoccus sp. CR14]
MLSSTFPLISANLELDTSEEAFGVLNSSADILHQPKVLAQRLDEDGYLYIPGFWERDEVRKVRSAIVDRMVEQGLLTADAIQGDIVVAKELQNAFIAEIGMGIPEVKSLLFGQRMMRFWENVFEESALHFDFIWLRAMGLKAYSKPHCDIVYMGRGTRQLYTAWTPFGDIGYDVGGLMLLEGSHKQRDRIKTYLSRDVDSYCQNGPHAEAIEAGEKAWEWDGALSKNPVSLREKFGGRWLSTEFKMGDVIVFGMEMIHASIQNQTDQIRISSDTRYQRSSQPADHRWVGENPIAHGLAGKRGRIC